MSKERLMSNIKECKRQWFEVGDLSPEAFDYLLTQAEQVQELEQQNKRYREAIDEIKELQSYTCHCECQDVIDVYELRNILFELELLESDSDE